MAKTFKNFPKIAEIFQKEATLWLSKKNGISFDWKEVNLPWGCHLRLIATSNRGFDIEVSATSDDISIWTSKHVPEIQKSWNKEAEQQGPGQLVLEVLEIAGSLLSTKTRIREFIAGKQPYRWQFETFDGNLWKIQETSGLLFWNYFGRRSEIIYQNDLLPGSISPFSAVQRQGLSICWEFSFLTAIFATTF